MQVPPVPHPVPLQAWQQRGPPERRARWSPVTWTATSFNVVVGATGSAAGCAMVVADRARKTVVKIALKSMAAVLAEKGEWCVGNGSRRELGTLYEE